MWVQGFLKLVSKRCKVNVAITVSEMSNLGLYYVFEMFVCIMLYQLNKSKNIFTANWQCVCVCCVLGTTPVVQQQRSASDWIKVLLGCGCAPFGKSGFGFEIQAQGEVLCHPQEGHAE